MNVRVILALKKQQKTNNQSELIMPEIEKIPLLLKVSDFHPRFEEAVALVSDSLEANELNFRTASVVLDEPDIVDFWGHVPEPILFCLLEKLAGQTLFSWLVQGENTVDRVNRLKGEDTDPKKCGQSTLRSQLTAMLGYRKVSLCKSDYTFEYIAIENYIHSPSAKELAVHMKFFEPYFQ